jgi:hypothetical protein
MTRIINMLIYPTTCMIIISLHIVFVAAAAAHPLSARFYDDSCPSVFRIVRRSVRSAIRNDPTVAAPLLRLHFHDCFVHVSRGFSTENICHLGFRVQGLGFRVQGSYRIEKKREGEISPKECV